LHFHIPLRLLGVKLFPLLTQTLSLLPYPQTLKKRIVLLLCQGGYRASGDEQ
jgi:hypothetical protein